MFLERLFSTSIGHRIWHVLYKIFRNREEQSMIDNSLVELFDQDCNDFVRDILATGKPCMISRFGSVELFTLCSYLISQRGFNWPLFKDWVRGLIVYNDSGVLESLCNNAGFFPRSGGSKLGAKYFELTMKDMKYIDVLGSWRTAERHFLTYLNPQKIVNLNGFYKPMFWNNPWTKYLKDKRVLVISPFTDSIKYQYENNRERIWPQNPEALPEFSQLLLLKAVQSIADEKDLPYKDWFEALDYMKAEIDKLDFDIAILGCGAYGMSLAAHVKRKGKQSVHMASWTQMLFGVYGTRWENDSFINEYWKRPYDWERPKGLKKVENGCYW